MSEMDPRDGEIDSLLRRSMVAPVPRLPVDFEQRLMGEMGQSSPLLNWYRRIVLAGYGLTAVVVSAMVMRGQGLAWGTVLVMIFGPLALVGVAGSVRRGAYTNMGQGAKSI